MDISQIAQCGGGIYTSEQRDSYWDSLKGWLIIMVVFGHFLHLGLNMPNVIMVNWIYSFHMPVFVFVSGYFTNPDSKNYWRGFLRIAETYLVFQILYTILFKDAIFTILLYPVFGLWYLMSLAFWRILAYFMIKLKWLKKQCVWIFGTLIASIIVCCIPVNNELTFQKTISFFPYFVMGMVARNHNVRSSTITKHSFPACLFLYGLTFAFFCWLREYFADVFSMSRSMYDIHIPASLQSFIGEDTNVYTFLKWTLVRTGCLLLGLASCWTHLNLPKSNLLAYVGRNSMILYIVHLFIYLSAQKVEAYIHYPKHLPFIVIYTILVVAFVCFMSKYKFVNNLLNPISFVKDKLKSNG